MPAKILKYISPQNGQPGRFVDVTSPTRPTRAFDAKIGWDKTLDNETPNNELIDLGIDSDNPALNEFITQLVGIINNHVDEVGKIKLMELLKSKQSAQDTATGGNGEDPDLPAMDQMLRRQRAHDAAQMSGFNSRFPNAHKIGQV